MSRDFSSHFSPSPLPASAVKPLPRTRRQFVASPIRFRSSAGNFLSQRIFGTTPNIAPPSRRKPEPRTMSSWSFPNLTAGSCHSEERSDEESLQTPEQIPRFARDDNRIRAPSLLRHEGLRRRVVAGALRAFRLHGRVGGVPPPL